MFQLTAPHHSAPLRESGQGLKEGTWRQEPTVFLFVACPVYLSMVPRITW